jgi:Spy/CpxP family protein refolding chaperone
MKKFSSIVLLSAALAGFASAPVYAQESAFGGTRLETLTEQLKLTNDQQVKIKALLENYAKEATEIRDDLIAAQESIRRVNLARLGKDDVTRLSREAGRLSFSHTAALLNTQRGFYALLDKDQKRIYNKMRSDALEAAGITSGN